MQYLTEHNIPFATHGRTELGIHRPNHDFDNDTFTVDMVKALVARGRRRLAVLTPPPSLTYYGHVVQGFYRGIQATGASGVVLSRHGHRYASQ